MDALHHPFEVHADGKVAEPVIMIVHQGYDPRREIGFLRVMLKPVPEYSLGVLGCERRKLFAAARGDEVNLVVDEPVLVAVTLFVEFVSAPGDAGDALGRWILLSLVIIPAR